MDLMQSLPIYLCCRAMEGGKFNNSSFLEEKEQ